MNTPPVGADALLTPADVAATFYLDPRTERAVFAAADRAKEAAPAAQQARAAATTKIATVVAETVRQQASAVQDHANAEAREVVAAAGPTVD